MKTSSFIILFCFLPLICVGQTKYFTINSQILQEERQVKLQLPRTYNSNQDQHYPLIVVFDADYLFEPIAGTVDYLNYWDEIPEAIIIGINQSKTRSDDFEIGKTRFLPKRKGADFFDFVEIELIQKLKEKYRIADFKLAVGHNQSANFINFFLLRESLLFNAYISLSPIFTNKMPERLKTAFKTKESKVFYYLAHAQADYETVKKKVKPLADSIGKIENPNVKLSYDQIEDATHFTMVSHSIPKAFEEIFRIYRPITPKTYEEKLLKSENVIEFLEEKYIKIEDLYALEMPYRINDILFAAKAIKKKEKWDALKDLSKMAKKSHPNKILGPYYRALYFEKIGKPKRAIKFYESAYSYESVGDITDDFVLKKANELKETFGY